MALCKNQNNQREVAKTFLSHMSKRLIENLKLMTMEELLWSTKITIPKNKFLSPSKPILSSTECLIWQISSYVDNMLQPFVWTVPYYIKDISNIYPTSKI